MNSVTCTVGRLVEIRFVEVRAPEDVVSVRATFAARVEGLRPRLAVVVADYRALTVLEPRAADEFLRSFKFGDSSRVERSALLVDPERATFMLQVERLIREADSAVRRSFRKPAELEVWLSAVLTVAEQERLHAFLAEGPAPRASPTPGPKRA